MGRKGWQLGCETVECEISPKFEIRQFLFNINSVWCVVFCLQICQKLWSVCLLRYQNITHMSCYINFSSSHPPPPPLPPSLPSHHISHPFWNSNSDCGVVRWGGIEKYKTNSGRKAEIVVVSCREEEQIHRTQLRCCHVMIFLMQNHVTALTQLTTLTCLDLFLSSGDWGTRCGLTSNRVWQMLPILYLHGS